MNRRCHFEIWVQSHFSAAHSLRGYPGDCERLHGHNWMVDVYVQCKKLDTLGIGIDFRDVKAAVRELLGELDHTELNALPPFHDENPSSENVARYLYHELGRKLNLPGVRVSKVRVSETPTAGVLYWED